MLTLAQKSPIVTLEIPPRAKLDWEWLSILDPNKPDDRLVAEAATYGNDAAIFSHDSGPRITAEDIGLKAYEPLEEWHLPPEQSEKDKQIAQLERKLKVAESNKPQLQIEIAGSDPKGKLTLYRPKVKPLDSAAVDRLTARYLEQYPRKRPVAAHPYLAVAMLDHISQAQVSSYHGDYDTFEGRVRAFFQKLHEHLLYLTVAIVKVTISNKGSVSAANFHVTLQTSGGFDLAPNADEIRKWCPFPKPPKEPKARDWLNPGNFGPIDMPTPPHPTKVVWIERPDLGASSGKYGCADFQPQRTYERAVVLYEESTLPIAGVLTITAGANDVADITATVEVTIKEREEEWHSPQVFESLPNFLQDELRELN